MKPRYIELKYDGKAYNKRYEIDDILIKNKMGWLIDCEVENLRIEIFRETLIINAGIIFNGVFVYGVIRSGEIRNMRFINGVIHNGVFKNITIERGIVFGGTFLGGIVKKDVQVRGGDFEPRVVFDKGGDEVVMNTNPIVVAQETPIITTDQKNESLKYVKRFRELL